MYEVRSTNVFSRGFQYSRNTKALFSLLFSLFYASQLPCHDTTSFPAILFCMTICLYDASPHVLVVLKVGNTFCFFSDKLLQ